MRMRKVIYSLIGWMLFAGISIAADRPGLTDVKEGEVQVTLNVPQIVSLVILTPHVVIVPGPEDYNRKLVLSATTTTKSGWFCKVCGRKFTRSSTYDIHNIARYMQPMHVNIDNHWVFYDENLHGYGSARYGTALQTAGIDVDKFINTYPWDLPVLLKQKFINTHCNPPPPNQRHTLLVNPAGDPGPAYGFVDWHERVHLFLHKCLVGTICNCEYADKGFLDRAEAIKIRIFSNVQNGAIVYVHGIQPTQLEEGVLRGILRLEDTFLTVMTEKTFVLANGIEGASTEGPGGYFYQTEPITGFARFLQMTNESQIIFRVTQATRAPRDVVFKLGIGNLDSYTEGDYSNTLVFTLIPKV